MKKYKLIKSQAILNLALFVLSCTFFIEFFEFLAVEILVWHVFWCLEAIPQSQNYETRIQANSFVKPKMEIVRISILRSICLKITGSKLFFLFQRKLLTDFSIWLQVGGILKMGMTRFPTLYTGKIWSCSRHSWVLQKKIQREVRWRGSLLGGGQRKQNPFIIFEKKYSNLCYQMCLHPESWYVSVNNSFINPHNLRLYNQSSQLRH